jgi:hypothetical protein
VLTAPSQPAPSGNTLSLFQVNLASTSARLGSVLLTAV